MDLLNFMLSVVIWFSPYSDADTPFFEIGLLGAIRLYSSFIFPSMGI